MMSILPQEEYTPGLAWHISLVQAPAITGPVIGGLLLPSATRLLHRGLHRVRWINSMFDLLRRPERKAEGSRLSRSKCLSRATGSFGNCPVISAR